MRIKAGEQLLGVPVLDLRNLMRRWSHRSASSSFIERELHLSTPAATKLLADLEGEGYVERETSSWRSGVLFTRTIKGAALAGATAAKPIRRALARMRLHELIGRMIEANADDRFFVGVQEAAVFGSYLGESADLGDLDIHYTTYRKISDAGEFMRVTELAAIASGRRFDSHIEMLYWPESELQRFLKQRLRIYSLADNSDLLRDPAVRRAAIFAGREPVKDWRAL